MLSTKGSKRTRDSIVDVKTYKDYVTYGPEYGLPWVNETRIWSETPPPSKNRFTKEELEELKNLDMRSAFKRIQEIQSTWEPEPAGLSWEEAQNKAWEYAYECYKTQKAPDPSVTFEHRYETDEDTYDRNEYRYTTHYYITITLTVVI